jgi:peptidoglycan/LPS O-acetylase OafA/YrhL
MPADQSSLTREERAPAATPAFSSPASGDQAIRHGIARGGRLASLDVLRCAAISLVLLQHAPEMPAWVRQFGWSGVDLFFVLSGFLVTSLLVEEQSVRGEADVVRFLIRRGFKIYPSFWAMIGCTIVFLLLTEGRVSPIALFCELAFVQNYGPGLWVNTWSLAVEEHFYLLVAACFAWAPRRIFRAPSARSVVAFVCVTALVVLALRLGVRTVVGARYKLTYWGTHGRIDGLAAGAGIAFLRHYHPEWLRAVTKRFGLWLLVLTGVPCLVTFTHEPNSAFVEKFGYSLVFPFCVALLVCVMTFDLFDPRNRIVRAVSYVGRHSYGIYLWHLLASAVAVKGLAALGVPNAGWVSVVGYVFAALVPGIVLSYAVEFPLLRLRDRLFPARAR